MKITIIGASAGVGLVCVQQALSKSHEVTTVSRRTEMLRMAPSLKVSRADVAAFLLSRAEWPALPGKHPALSNK